MKLNFHHKLDLTKSTEIIITHPKRKERKKRDDNYDLNDKLIEKDENEEIFVSIETNFKNFFTYQGELTENSQEVLKKYENRKNRALNNKNWKNKIIDDFSENFGFRAINLYNEKKEYFSKEIENFCKISSFQKNIPDNDLENILKKNNIFFPIEQLILLESFFTNKSFKKISSDISELNGPNLTDEILKIILIRLTSIIDETKLKFETEMDDLIRNEKREQNSELIFTKNIISNFCNLIDKSSKKYFVEHLLSSQENKGNEGKKTHRKVKREYLNDVLKKYNEKDSESLKKRISKFDFYKIAFPK